MRRRKPDLHAEEEEVPRIAGNMIVLSRDAISGYKLKCSCENEFMYVPNGLNSIEIQRHVTDKTVKAEDTIKQFTAVCPACQCLWNANVEFKHRPGSVYFSYFVTTADDKDPKLVGIGRETSRCAAVCHAAHEVKLSEIKFENLIVSILTEKEFKEAREKIQSMNNLMKFSLFGALAGVDFSKLFGGEDEDKKPKR